MSCALFNRNSHIPNAALCPPEGHGEGVETLPLFQEGGAVKQRSQDFLASRLLHCLGLHLKSQPPLPSPNTHRDCLRPAPVHPRLSANCSLTQGFSPEGSVSLTSAGDVPPQC